MNVDALMYCLCGYMLYCMCSPRHLLCSKRRFPPTCINGYVPILRVQRIKGRQLLKINRRWCVRRCQFEVVQAFPIEVVQAFAFLIKGMVSDIVAAVFQCTQSFCSFWMQQTFDNVSGTAVVFKYTGCHD